MVANSEPVYGHKLSTVVPANVTGENMVHELTNMDLVVKNHYIRTVYYFKASEVLDELNIMKLKLPMFGLLDVYYPVTGRVRRTTSGRPLIKCNDCGVRIVETSCDMSIDEWVESKDSSSWRQLVPEKELGPDLQFSPLVYIQFTKFKCGGMSIGFSWAHVLGDPISAQTFIQFWGHLLSGNTLPKSLQLRDSSTPKQTTESAVNSRSIKQVEPTGDHWSVPNTTKMSTHSLRITDTKLKQLHPQSTKSTRPFDVISGLILYSLAKVRVDREPKLVTLCRNDTSAERNGLLKNGCRIGTLSLDSSPVDVGYEELVSLISKQGMDEAKGVQELVDYDTGRPDFVVYGANLTLVDMQGIDLYGLQIKGQKPIRVDFCVGGVGDEGAVIVYKGAQVSSGNAEESSSAVMLVLPQDEIVGLKEILEREFGVV